MDRLSPIREQELREADAWFDPPSPMDARIRYRHDQDIHELLNELTLLRIDNADIRINTADMRKRLESEWKRHENNLASYAHKVLQYEAAKRALDQAKQLLRELVAGEHLMMSFRHRINDLLNEP